MTKTNSHPFVTYLEGLTESRGALAALRRGLGRPPGTVPDMYPYVVPWLGENPKFWDENAYYLVASLFAMHPKSAPQGNMGAHFARARALAEAAGASDIAVERRFTALLAAHPDDLPFHLRQAVSFLRSKDVSVNWHALLFDLRYWGHEERFVQKRWAQAFWSKAKPKQDETTTESA